MYVRMVSIFSFQAVTNLRVTIFDCLICNKLAKWHFSWFSFSSHTAKTYKDSSPIMACRISDNISVLLQLSVAAPTHGTSPTSSELSYDCNLINLLVVNLWT